ncbi:MAG TPA: bifunctional pyr operon transcriptional regulator/uracil phosphoribosyltransferase PyrR [Saprospiraceae bacterium]|nr:bifunctional pyr operon transcriptional regulator/uracil phosphoribosyltransferase PyrR [Saprospiraceae bacterium]HMP24928.1 bifunctional pyr operon transcriptional regulator/uracil phosphoribosyltransferase PyrR [Saprospiraceae bacterium]
MSDERVILTRERFALTMERLCRQLIETYDGFEDTCMIGVQPRGIYLANRIHQRLLQMTGLPQLKYGQLDITFYRDDFRRRDKPLAPSATQMDFIVEDKNVVLIDDVLYTGRTIQAALTALNHYGRPRSVELLVLVDRRFNRHLPVQADFVGITIDALDEAYVRVEWQETHGEDCILLFADKPAAG